MCNVISNRLIIGNYLIESVEKGVFSFSFDDYCRFDEILSPKLEKLDYYSSFDTHGFWEFIEDYSFIVKSISDSRFSITNEMDTDFLRQVLYNYFRIGIKKPISDAISEASEIYWGANA